MTQGHGLLAEYMPKKKEIQIKKFIQFFSRQIHATPQPLSRQHHDHRCRRLEPNRRCQHSAHCFWPRKRGFFLFYFIIFFFKNFIFQFLSPPHTHSLRFSHFFTQLCFDLVFLRTAITSHLQTGGVTIVLGSNRIKVNLLIHTLALFLSPGQ